MCVPLRTNTVLSLARACQIRPPEQRGQFVKLSSIQNLSGSQKHRFHSQVCNVGRRGGPPLLLGLEDVQDLPDTKSARPGDDRLRVASSRDEQSCDVQLGWDYQVLVRHPITRACGLRLSRGFGYSGSPLSEGFRGHVSRSCDVIPGGCMKMIQGLDCIVRVLRLGRRRIVLEKLLRAVSC